MDNRLTMIDTGDIAFLRHREKERPFLCILPGSRTANIGDIPFVLGCMCTLRSDRHRPDSAFSLRPLECIATWRDTAGNSEVSMVRSYTITSIRAGDFEKGLRARAEGNTVRLCREQIRLMLREDQLLDDILPTRRQSVRH